MNCCIGVGVKLSVLAPLYNEDATCVDLLRRVDAASIDKEIIVVDDGSMRSVADEIRAALPSVRQFAHPLNRGKGAAIRTALSYATGDVVIIQDADSEYFPEDYVQLLRMGAKIVEAPIRHQARTDGKKLTPRDGLPTVAMLIRCLRWRPQPASSRPASKPAAPMIGEPRPRV
jgi:glycosyltransferase involved in cell wall biosynthesis